MTEPNQEEPVAVLSVGSIVGGPSPANRPWQDGIARLSLAVRGGIHGVSSTLNLNVVFHVPGSFLKPEFEGVRTGTFRKRDAHLMVQVAIPEQVPPDVDGYLRDCMLRAIDDAEAWSTRRKRADDLDPLRAAMVSLPPFENQAG